MEGGFAAIFSAFGIDNFDKVYFRDFVIIRSIAV